MYKSSNNVRQFVPQITQTGIQQCSQNIDYWDTIGAMLVHSWYTV